MHVATSTIDQLLDYVMNTAPDGLRSATSVETIYNIVDKNNQYVKNKILVLAD
jgi:4-O-beta-D-mannosyl-D-glucose phosphorylase